MHPEDVQELLVEQVAELKRMLGDLSELDVNTVELVGTDILISQTVAHTAVTDVPPALALQLSGAKTLLIAAPGGGVVQQVVSVPQKVPDLSRITSDELLLRVGCDDFDGQPPLAELLRPSDRTPLPGPEWPTDPSGRGIVDGHPLYKRKFFCRPGFREFHSHPEHQDTPWDAIRHQSSIGGLLIPLLNDLKTRWRMQ
jgi:hypothetical protein